MDQKLQDALHIIRKRIEEYDTLIDKLPGTVEGFDSMLRELSEAEYDCVQHFVRFPRPLDDVDPYMGRKDVEDDWTRCHRRREEAIRSMILVATKRHPVNKLDK